MDNNATDDNLKSLQDLNAQVKEFNTLLADIITSMNADKLKTLIELNPKIKEFNEILVSLSESLKKDVISHELHQVI